MPIAAQGCMVERNGTSLSVVADVLTFVAYAWSDHSQKPTENLKVSFELTKPANAYFIAKIWYSIWVRSQVLTTLVTTLPQMFKHKKCKFKNIARSEQSSHTPGR